MLVLLLAPQPQPAQPEYINLAALLGDVYPQLGASGPNDLVFWSDDELYRWLDEAAERLGRSVGVFVARDTTITSATGTGPYSLPARHVSTIQADLFGKVLRPRNVQQIEALDSDWQNTAGTPEAFLQDTQGLQLIVLYPIPDSGSNNKAVGLIMHTYPATINASNALLSAPLCIREYFAFHALSEARAKETKAAMPEVSKWHGQLSMWMQSVMRGYWGKAQ